jgi:hypothetical protein
MRDRRLGKKGVLVSLQNNGEFLINATFLFTRAAGFSGRFGAGGGLSDIFGSIDTGSGQEISPLAADRRARASRFPVGTERRGNTSAEPN